MAQGKVELEPIVSSNLKAIAYDGKKRILYIQFKYNDKIFGYSPISRERFQAFKKSKSKGTVFHKEIKTDGTLDVEEVELRVCDNCDETFDEAFMKDYSATEKVCESCDKKVIR